MGNRQVPDQTSKTKEGAHLPIKPLSCTILASIIVMEVDFTLIGFIVDAIDTCINLIIFEFLGENQGKTIV